ncbi:MAG TPA: threonine synthase [Bacteroidota bacterium]
MSQRPAHSFLTHLECTTCGDRHSPYEIQTVCRTCGKSLAARYDLKSAQQILSRDWFRSQPSNLWKYFPLLPVQNPSNIVSLGEVTTPLIRLRSLDSEFGSSQIWMKDEGILPTGSFKARGLAMAVSKARELGVRKVCIPSAGNAAGALAAYAARSGMEAHIFIPRDTPEINIHECRAYGADVTLVEGTISDAAKLMNERKTEHPDWFDMSTLKEPYRLEGKKTMGFELAEQFEWRLPDTIVYPTGGGTGLIGMWKAFDELEGLGVIGSKRPTMVAVQSEGCAPIVRAFAKGEKESEFWKGAATVASGLRVPKAFADYWILEILYASGGQAVAVSDKEILDSVAAIAATEGLFLCPEGAATVAGIRKLRKQGKVPSEGTILLFNTAAGNKYSGTTQVQG